ncbi:MAG: alpha-amylase/4-alpha-glucanotransferase domain-containing protein [Chloroflexia bacterium]
MPNQKHISLGLVFHNHQPVGQSDAVFEEIYERSYELMVAALERHPGVQVGLHYTGSLLDWLREHKPDFMRRVRALAERGQVEILSGGYYEPILPSIPDDDKRSQILKLTNTVQREFAYDPSGMWLAERVWEPTLPTHLAGAGISWTLLDDIHFKMAGLTDDDLTGYFVTEDNGHAVNVFGTSKQLRYTIPWRNVDETLQYMYGEAIATTGKILVMGDDGEKFGAWPDTYEHCWGSNGRNGWVDRFFSALEENRSWLHTVKLGEHVRHFPAAGRIYLPTASYNEMMEWALPAKQSYEFTELYHKLEEKEDPTLRFMKGGFWRNFMVKYPEINTQHKKMLRVHDLIAQAQQAQEEWGDADRHPDIGHEDLWRGQSNDTYWHGLFGGVYMTDIRVRVHGHLLRAQQAAERAMYGDQDWIKPEIIDFDRDSLHELLIEGNALNLYIDLAEGGSIFEWALRKHNYNLAATVSRRPEGYHETLRQYEAARRKKESGVRDQVLGDGQGTTEEIQNPKSKIQNEEEPASPHSSVRVKEKGLDRFLNYDLYRRNCMIEHFLAPNATLESFIRSEHEELGDFATGAYQAEMDATDNVLYVVLERDGSVITPNGHHPIRVSKRLRLKPGSSNFRLLYSIQNLGGTELSVTFGSEWNINLLGGGHNPTAYYKVEGHDLQDAALDSTGGVPSVSQIALGNSWLGIEMQLTLSREAKFWRFPLETISGSEAGFERVYQGSCIILQWPLTLAPGEHTDIELEWTSV